MENITVDHREIRNVVERSGGRPAIFFKPEEGEQIDFSWGLRTSEKHHDSQDISWDEFFDRFDMADLAFRYIIDEDFSLKTYSFTDRRGKDNEFLPHDMPDNDDLSVQNEFSSLESDRNLEVHPDDREQGIQM